MSTIVIRYNGVDITNDVQLDGAEFKSRTDANVGDAYFRVLDRKPNYSLNYFKPGNEVTLEVDSKRVWGGYVESVSYEYPGSAWWVETTTPRFFSIRCVDYNILFHKRVLWNKAEPVKQMKEYTPQTGGATDKDIIRDMVNLYLDLSGDGFESGGSDAIDLSNVNEEGAIFWIEACSQKWQAASPGMKWADAMKRITDWSGCVFYIGPQNPSGSHKGPTLYYHDVNTKTGPYELNDRPASDPGSAGVQDFEMVEDINQMATEALVWGAGMGSSEMVFHRETAGTQQSTYGTYQWGDFHTAMWKLECVKHRAKTYIHGSRQNKRGHKKPRESWKATIFTPDFLPGDVVDMHSYVFDVQDNVPIREMKITFINKTTAKFELMMSHQMDTAYSTAMWWDPDSPDPDIDDPPPAGPGEQVTWFTQTIPLGIGPIITPGPFDPPGDSRYTCYPGPQAALTDKIRAWSDGTVERLGPQFLPFDGNDDFGSYLERLGNHPWYNCPCGGICLGCWGGRWVSVQYWYQITIPAGFDNTLYVLGERITYEGTPGEMAASLVTSQDQYDNFHNEIAQAEKMLIPGTTGSGGSVATGGSIGGVGTYVSPNGWGGFYDPTVTGEETYLAGCEEVMDGRLPPMQTGQCAKYHWYSGCWGGYSYIPTFSLSDPPAGQNVWLVFTADWGGTHDPQPPWCDTSCCQGGVAAGQGPRAEGLGGSGGYDLPLTLDTIYCGGSGTYGDVPDSTEDTGVGYYQAPTDKVYYTHFPYVPGSLEVYFGGIPYHEFVEMDPATGQFSVHIGGMYSYGQFSIRYLQASPDPTEFGGMGDYNSETHITDPGAENDGTAGAVYRPTFRSTYGWKTEYDGANVQFAQMCHFIERTTQGTQAYIPSQIREASNLTGFGQYTLSSMVDICKSFQVGYWWAATISWEQLVAGINEGRGVVIPGDPTKLGTFAPRTGVGLYTGPHMLYINEVRSESADTYPGWMLVYDSARRTADDGVFWCPPSVIRDYAASGAQDRDGVVNALFTYKTQRI